MSVLDSKKTIKNLKNKGFVSNKTDHIILELWHNGKFVLHTKISHGSKHDITESLIHKMAHQCMLPRQSFIDLANCPLSHSDYLNILKEKEAIK